MARNEKCRFHGGSYKELTVSQWKELKNMRLPQNPWLFNKGSRGSVKWMIGDSVLNGPELQKGIPTREDLYRMYHSDAAGLPSEPVQVMPDKIPVDSRHKAQRSGSAQPRVRDQGLRGSGRSEKIRSTSTMPRRQHDLKRTVERLEYLAKNFNVDAETGRAA